MKDFAAEKYIAPEMVEYEMLPEGILCGSNEEVGEEPGGPWDPNF